VNQFDALADLAEILTAIVAVFAYSRYQWVRWNNRKKLEAYLANEYERVKTHPRYKNDKGKHSALHISARLRLTEAEVLEVGFKSKRSRAIPVRDRQTGRAVAVYFQYIPESSS
jgi:hypothetical protein